jgi:hypothetical protein
MIRPSSVYWWHCKKMKPLPMALSEEKKLEGNKRIEV